MGRGDAQALRLRKVQLQSNKQDFRFVGALTTKCTHFVSTLYTTPPQLLCARLEIRISISVCIAEALQVSSAYSQSRFRFGLCELAFGDKSPKVSTNVGSCEVLCALALCGVTVAMQCARTRYATPCDLQLECLLQFDNALTVVKNGMGVSIHT